jgi:hypothetical protein
MGERSVSRERECLSPPVQGRPHERAALTPALQGGASVPRKVKVSSCRSPSCCTVRALTAFVHSSQKIGDWMSLPGGSHEGP